MGRLKGRQSPPRLGRPSSRLRAAPETEQERSSRRDDEQTWRRWYKTARWQRLRREVLKRDGYTCQRTGEMLVGKHPAPNSPVVNHKVPHRGDPDLFWSIDNLETVAKHYHDQEIQRQERARY